MVQFIVNNLFFIVLIAALWTLPWKGMALWKAAHRRDLWWFVAFLVINTLGILEILYIFMFSRRGKIEKNV